MRMRVWGRRAAMLAALAGTIAPGLAWGGVADCHLNKISELALKLERNQPIVEGSINGKAVRALLDTGSYRTMLTSTGAARLGLDVTKHYEAGKVAGVGGEVHIGSAPVDKLTIGSWQVNDLRLQVIDNSNVGPGVELILGQDIFSQADVELDFAHSIVRFFQPQGCDDVPLAYWAQSYAEALMKPPQGRRTANIVHVALNGYEFWATLDTGASHSSLQQRIAHRAGVHEDDAGVTPGGGSHGIGKDTINTWIGTFETFTIGDETVRNVKIRFGDYSRGWDPEKAGATDMLLGADFIKTHHIYIANSQNKLYFTNVGRPIFSVEPVAARTESEGGKSEDKGAGSN
ncbi:MULTISPECIES: retropepsin-like aspartic protease [Nitrospirillum]|uniref:Aspartyl protease n=1 Tax=Nitrospirillum amazonense TaxID=28077 RepID=A0A560G180_9PROT|nr:retropepsin-like aspartic protease [Nitrospirillum amazonense]MEC4589588.1 retropepsin-like aspartic protease [Nitrospirillum amazonense]TWB27599.1 aspartyl protease [Nitrospirillum amazonense]